MIRKIKVRGFEKLDQKDTNFSCKNDCCGNNK